MVLTELVTNGVRHADVEHDHSVTVELCLFSDVVRVEVRDSGPGFVPPARALEDDQVGGWGLVLVDQISDRWGVASDAPTRVWFELDRDPDLQDEETKQAA